MSSGVLLPQLCFSYITGDARQSANLPEANDHIQEVKKLYL